MDWNKIKTFHAVAEAGSFTKASEILGINQSSVSRKMATLEEELNVKLFLRHARGLTLTEAGHKLYGSAQRMLVDVHSIEASLSETRSKPKGPLRIATTVGFGSTWLTSRINGFLDLYPDIQLQLVLSDEDVDLTNGDVDGAIWLHQPNQVEFIQRKLFTVHFHLYASVQYVERYGQPKTIQDLDNHRLVTFGRPAPAFLKSINWPAKVERPLNARRASVFEVNNVYAMRKAIKNGVGLAMLPDYIVEDETGLIRINLAADYPTFDSYFVYLPELKDSRRLQTFRDFIYAQGKSWKF